MRLKNILKASLATLLVLVSAFALFGCKEKDDGQAHEGVLPNQIKNTRFYFQQGYRTDWGIKQGRSDEYLAKEETGLAIQLAPYVMTTDSEGNEVPSSDFLEGVEYTVYYNVSKKINMTSTQAEVLSWIMDEDNEDFFFNTVHYDNSARETFMTKGEPTTYTAKYSKLQFKQVSYTFTRDGEDWQGIYSLVMKGREYFIITYEAKVDLYTKYETQFKETIGDFRKVGWETSDVG